MKKILNNSRLIAIAIFSVLTVGVAPFAQASDSVNHKVMPVELKLIGNINNQPLFQLTFAGAEQDDFTIVIRDESGNSLYRENVKAESFTKKFLLNNDELGEGTVRFEVTSKKQNKTVAISM